MNGSGIFQKPAEPYEPRGRLDPAGFARNVRFVIVEPEERLKPFVAHFWTIHWEDIESVYDSAEVMHRPYVDIFFGREHSGIQATFRGKRVYQARGTGRIIGARFRPGAFHAFWPDELSNLQDQMLPIERLFPDMDAPAVASLLSLEDHEAIAELSRRLLALQPQPDTVIELINAIIAAIEADETLTTVAGVAEVVGYSERWVQQTFRDYLGVGLKWFLQRRRLLAAAARVRAEDNPDWAGIAYELGYSSQQHFITDFRQVVGETPLQYKAGLTDASPAQKA